MNATIKTGGKQYNIKVGQFFDVEKLDAKVGDIVTFEPIFISDGDKIVADSIEASKVTVKAEVLKQHKGKKKIVFKFKRRKNYKVKNGHRQQLTLIKIISIGDEKLKETNKASKKSLKDKSVINKIEDNTVQENKAKENKKVSEEKDAKQEDSIVEDKKPVENKDSQVDNKVEE